ncbi:MAG: ABC transporter ATP-binding protein, partial [Alphaproteobacteria bacterium]
MLIDDRDVTALEPAARDIAMVFQNYALYPHMRVFDNMAYGLRIRGLAKDDIKRRVGEAAELLGLSALLDRRPKELSGGQRQRVAMGRAIVREPKLFLFDEPLSNLDAKLRVAMRAEIKRLQRRLGVTSLFVTHDQVEAMTLGDRLVVMHEGRAAQIASPMEIFERPADTYVAGFIGSPAMNFIPAKLEQASGALRLHLPQGIVLDVPAARTARYQALAGKDVLFGIRPEHLTDDKPTDKSNTAPITLRPEVIEPMGMETLVHFKLDGSEVSARLDPATPAAVGAPLSLIAHMD